MPSAAELLPHEDTPENLPPELAAVRHEGLLKFLPRTAVEELARVGKIIHYPDGSEIKIRRDQRLLVIGGTVITYLDDAAGARYPLMTAEVGTLLGELHAYAHKDPKDEKIALVAEGHARGLLVPESVFEGLVHRNIGAMTFIAELQAERLVNTNRFAQQLVKVEMDPDEVVPRSFGDRMADIITRKIGTWNIVAGYMGVSALWVGANAFQSWLQWDPYPFVFLNLGYSFLSGFTMPVVLMTQNRQSAADRIASRITKLKVLELSRQVNTQGELLAAASSKIDEMLALLKDPSRQSGH